MDRGRLRREVVLVPVLLLVGEQRGRCVVLGAAPALLAVRADRVRHRHAAIRIVWALLGRRRLRAGQLDVKRSRTMHEDHATKTHGSERTVRLPSAVVAALRGVLPLHVEPNAFVFRNVQGDPIHAESFTRHEWSAAIRATGVRARKFYAARHTCASVLLSAGVPAKLVAEQLGTSLAMLQLHYGRYMATASDALDAALGLDSGTVPEQSPNRDRNRDLASISR